MKKKFFLLLIAFVFIISLSACGNSSDANNKTNNLLVAATPKQTIKIAFESLKNANSKQFNQLVQYDEGRHGAFVYKDNKLFGNNLNEKEKKYTKSIFANLSYKIGEVNENKDSATAQVKVINRDLSNVDNDILRYKDSDDPLIEAIKNTDSKKMVTTDLKIKLHKTNGVWKIKMDGPLMDALCGGLISSHLKLLPKSLSIFCSFVK
ncbi:MULTISPECIES: hypothetical protein [Clostridium]|uniref:hypothetical protein n=1 Tax=Clostridium TaxID=1485 RepID=UPI000824659A|nr:MULTISPECIES: hypothetical protein [Clostridium]PJI08169.1 hypothetical protein CUB90_09965 [Clostridium sp. CT7]